MLRPAANRRKDLLGIGCGKHEHDMVRGFFQRFQQRVRRGLREHVNLVDDVHLPAPGRGEGSSCNEVSHGINAIVGRRVELVDVEGGTPRDIHAGVAHTARLTVDRAFAIQCLREDPRGRRLPSPSRPGEEVRVRHAIVPHGMAEGVDNMVLAADLGKALRAVAPVEGLVIDH